MYKKVKAYTDIEQSKKLAEILPPESADMARCGGENVIMTDYISAKKKFSVCGELTITPCWSLAGLLNILPHPGCFQETSSHWFCDCFAKNGCYYEEEASNPVDACVEMVCKLKENNML